MIYLSRIIDGATAGNLSLVQAYIADNTTPENRHGVRPDRHRLRPRLLHRPVAHRVPLGLLRPERADLPGGGDVGDQRPVHGDAAAGAAGRPRPDRHRSLGALTGGPTRSTSRGRRCAPGCCSSCSSCCRSRRSSPASRCSPSGASPGTATVRPARDRLRASASSACSASSCRAVLIGRLVQRYGEARLVSVGFIALVARLLLARRRLLDRAAAAHRRRSSRLRQRRAAAGAHQPDHAPRRAPRAGRGCSASPSR